MGFIIETWEKFNEQYEAYINKGKLNKLKVFIDLLLSFVFIGSTVTDYFSYEFYRLNYSARKEYVVFRVANRYFDFFNDSEDSDKLTNKDQINLLFKDYIKRDWISVDESDYSSFVAFIEDKKKCVLKPLDGSCGEGIEFIDIKDIPSEDRFSQMKNKNMIIEEYIIQHEKMASLNRSSTNTMRITTVRTENKVHIMFASVRAGVAGMQVDNFSSGGLAAAVDIDTGIINTVANDLNGNKYTVHPDSREKIVGFEIPYWKEAISLVNELSMKVPTVRYTGWDIIILEDGPALIEANARGMFIGQQCHTREGIRKKYEEVIKEIKNESQYN